MTGSLVTHVSHTFPCSADQQSALIIFDVVVVAAVLLRLLPFLLLLLPVLYTHRHRPFIMSMCIPIEILYVDVALAAVKQIGGFS